MDGWDGPWNCLGLSRDIQLQNRRETTLCFGIVDKHPAGSRQLPPCLYADAHLLLPLMHTESNKAVDNKGTSAVGKGAWVLLCPSAPFLLHSS